MNTESVLAETRLPSKQASLDSIPSCASCSAACLCYPTACSVLGPCRRAGRWPFIGKSSGWQEVLSAMFVGENKPRLSGCASELESLEVWVWSPGVASLMTHAPGVRTGECLLPYMWSSHSKVGPRGPLTCRPNNLLSLHIPPPLPIPPLSTFLE